MEPNVPVEQPVDQPVAPEAQAPVEPQQQTETAPESVETESAPVEQTSTTSEVVEDTSTVEAPAVEEEYSTYQPSQFDIDQLPRDPQNPDYVDPNAFVAAISQQAREQARAEFAEQRKEEKLWQQAEEAYPELRQNKDLRDIVHNSRMGEVVTGKNPSPKAIADRLFKHLNGAKKEGVVQAQTNVTVQEGARLETSSTRSTANATDRSALMGQLSSYDTTTREAATDALLKDMFDSGDLQLPRG